MTAETIRSLPGARVLVVGDVMLDDYSWGDALRISPEAPIPVVEVTRRTSVPGGAANVAHGVRALGGEALLGGVIGDDPDGDRLTAAAQACGIDCGGLLLAPGRPTTTKTRVIARSQQIVRVDHEERRPVAADVGQRLFSWARAGLRHTQALVVSDYAKGVFTDATCARLIADGIAARIPVIVDPKGADYARYEGATLITPNLGEAQRAAKMEVQGDDEGVTAVAERLGELLAGTHILITRGPGGMLLRAADGTVTTVAVQAREVHDVTGAGDTVVATLATALARGIDLPSAVELANDAAAVAVSHIGAAAVRLDELLHVAE